MASKAKRKSATDAPTFTRHLVAVNQLQPARYNPRAIGDEELAGLKHSLATFGMVQEIVVNRGPDGRLMRVVGGHQRLRAAIELGWTEVPCVFVNLDDAHEKALNITLNSRKVQGSFTDRLGELLASIDIGKALATDLRLDELAVEAALIVSDDALRQVEETANRSSAEGGDSEAKAPPPPEGAVRDGDPDSQGMLQFALPVTESQLSTLRQGIAAAKREFKSKNNAAALVAIVKRFLKEKR